MRVKSGFALLLVTRIFTEGLSFPPKVLNAPKILLTDSSATRSCRRQQGASRGRLSSNFEDGFGGSDTRLYNNQLGEPKHENMSSASLHLANQVYSVLAQPSMVSLPNGILMALVLLPFLSTTTQTILTYTIFSGLNHVKDKMWSELTVEKQDFKKNPLSDIFSFGMAFSAARHLAPLPSVAGASVGAASHNGFLSPGPAVVLFGLFCAAAAVFYTRVSLPVTNDVRAEENSLQPSQKKEKIDKLESEIRDQANERLFSDWDKQMETRER